MNSEGLLQSWNSIQKEARQKVRAPLTEEAVLQLLDQKPKLSPGTLPLVNVLLGSVGTIASTPYLARHLKFPKNDVKCSAIHALMRIGGPATLPLFEKALNTENADVKRYALLALNKRGGEREVEGVARRVLYRLKKQPGPPNPMVRLSTRPPEILIGLQFLTRFVDSSVAAKSILEALRRRPDRLNPEELNWLEQHWGGPSPDIPILRDCR